MKSTLHARDPVAIYVGKARLAGTIIGTYDEELHPGVYRVQLRDLSFVDAHVRQIRKLKLKATTEPKRYWMARFEGPTLTPEGLSLPHASLAEAQAVGDRGQKLTEIVEVVEVKRHRIEDVPPRPAFLAKTPSP